MSWHKTRLDTGHLRAGWEEAVRLRVLVADRMLQLVAQDGGSDAKLVLLLRQLAAKFTRMKPAGQQEPLFLGYNIIDGVVSKDLYIC